MKTTRFSLLLALLFGASLLSAQRIGIGLNAGTNGFGLDASAHLAGRFGLRAGYNLFKVNFEDKQFKIPASGQETLPATGTFDASNIMLLADYRIILWLRVNAGLSLAASKRFLEFDADASGAELNLFGHIVSVPAGSTTHVVIEEDALARPYFGVSLGRLVPKRRLGISGDLGVFRYPSPNVVAVDPSTGQPNPVETAAVKASFEQKWKTDWWPVLNFRLAFRLI